MKRIYVFEVAPPFRWKWKKEGDFPKPDQHKHIVIVRYIWLWFSVTVIKHVGWPELLQRHALAAIEHYIEDPSVFEKIKQNVEEKRGELEC